MKALFQPIKFEITGERHLIYGVFYTVYMVSGLEARYSGLQDMVHGSLYRGLEIFVLSRSPIVQGILVRELVALKSAVKRTYTQDFQMSMKCLH